MSWGSDLPHMMDAHTRKLPNKEKPHSCWDRWMTHWLLLKAKPLLNQPPSKQGNMSSLLTRRNCPSHSCAQWRTTMVVMHLNSRIPFCCLPRAILKGCWKLMAGKGNHLMSNLLAKMEKQMVTWFLHCQRIVCLSYLMRQDPRKAPLNLQHLKRNKTCSLGSCWANSCVRWQQQDLTLPSLPTLQIANESLSLSSLSSSTARLHYLKNKWLQQSQMWKTTKNRQLSLITWLALVALWVWNLIWPALDFCMKWTKISSQILLSIGGMTISYFSNLLSFLSTETLFNWSYFVCDFTFQNCFCCFCSVVAFSCPSRSFGHCATSWVLPWCKRDPFRSLIETFGSLLNSTSQWQRSMEQQRQQKDVKERKKRCTQDWTFVVWM